MKPRSLCLPGAVLAVMAWVWGVSFPANASSKKATEAGSAASKNVGFLLQSGVHPGAPATPYYPWPGDILLYDDYNPLHHFVYAVVARRCTPPW